ncbi:RagB/SusD family nutrient uptake outer membrane protein [Sphingobacterium sp. UBA2074]|uniref:RagB/SusD family nutrient uptake outer membrane protein n=1 Tax=Sphingobacterium sp. UBA2074 TaxID=1947487 RepID=UPI00257AC93D|nr:RagB/SusD family nutrient uptake outer membrane protein [Sphingobacterium sp. UBA2074]
MQTSKEMMMNINKNITSRFAFLLLFMSLYLTSCKDSFLDVKPSTDIVSPKTLDDFQQMLDYPRINQTSALPFLASDEYNIPEEKDWLAQSNLERNVYIWSDDRYGGQTSIDDFNYPYEGIFYANSVITGMENLQNTAADRKKYNHILGQAYFARAFSCFDLVKNFAAPYDLVSAQQELGMALKRSPNVDEVVQRSSVQENYDQILFDLNRAVSLLDLPITADRNRANKPSAYALAARIYLSMRNYELAEKYADSCLALYDKLIDYNTISLTVAAPFTLSNEESMLYSTVGRNYSLVLYASTQNMSIDTELYNLYADNDLRKSIFFSKNATNGLIKTKRGYSGSSRFPYSGLATDEVYLIKGECAARRNDLRTCKDYLFKLLSKRYKTGTFTMGNFLTKDEAVKKVLIERRKELVWRGGLRWDDIRRLNKEGANISLSRKLGNEIYVLEAGSPRFAFPIPTNESIFYTNNK